MKFLHYWYFMNFRQRSFNYLLMLKFHNVRYSLTMHYKIHFLNYVYIYASFLKFWGLVFVLSSFSSSIYRWYCATKIRSKLTTLYSYLVILVSARSLTFSTSIGYSGAILTKISARTLRAVATTFKFGNFNSVKIVSRCLICINNNIYLLFRSYYNFTMQLFQ